MRHVTLITPLYSLPVYKIYHSSFSHSRAVVGAHQNLNG